MVTISGKLGQLFDLGHLFRFGHLTDLDVLLYIPKSKLVFLSGFIELVIFSLLIARKRQIRTCVKRVFKLTGLLFN